MHGYPRSSPPNIGGVSCEAGRGGIICAGILPPPRPAGGTPPFQEESTAADKSARYTKAYAPHKWWPRRESNPHAVKRALLRRVCLPFHHSAPICAG